MRMNPFCVLKGWIIFPRYVTAPPLCVFLSQGTRATSTQTIKFGMNSDGNSTLFWQNINILNICETFDTLVGSGANLKLFQYWSE